MAIGLRSSFPQHFQNTIAFWLPIIVVLLAASADWWERRRANQLRTLTVEEQETVISAIDLASRRHRIPQERIRELRSQVTNPATPALVDEGIVSESLLWEENNSILFSPLFFDADPISQEKSITAIARIDPD